MADYAYDDSYERHYTTYRDGIDTDVNSRTDYTYHYVDRVNYSEKTVSGNASGQLKNTSSYNSLRNEPEERINTVSEKEIRAYSVDHTTKTTDLDTGSVSSYNSKYKTEALNSYEYVGNTGKFVGWDWSWGYDIDDVYDPGKLTSYSVTEYKYDSSTGEWTKASVTVSVKSTYNSETGKSELAIVEPDVDFKTVYPADLFESYNVSSSKYVFDDSIITGRDNWRETDSLHVDGSNDYSYSSYTETEKVADTELEKRSISQSASDSYSSEHVSEQTVTYNIDEAEYEYGERDEITDPAEIAEVKADRAEFMAETEAIVLGGTVVTDDSGNLKQADVKGEMLALENALKQEGTYEITEGYFEKAMAQEENAGQILDFLDGKTTVLDQSPEMKQYVESTAPLAETTVPAISEAVVNPTPVAPTVEVKPAGEAVSAVSAAPVAAAAADPAPAVEVVNSVPAESAAPAAPSGETVSAEPVAAAAPAPAPVEEVVSSAPAESSAGTEPSGGETGSGEPAAEPASTPAEEPANPMPDATNGETTP